jgi:hypothetical protein
MNKKFGIKIEIGEPDKIKNNGWNITTIKVTKENFLWNFIILSIPKNLSKNLAVSPEKIKIERKTNPINPASFPVAINKELNERSFRELKTT